MPFFKKKKNNEEKKDLSKVAGYPTQAQPTAPVFEAGTSGHTSSYPAAPPSYSEAIGQAPPTMQQGYPAVSQPSQHPPANPQLPPPPQTVVVHGAFDPGARFDGIATPNIPPPPPGCAPNAAQMASMQGHTVVASQRPESFLTGGSDGGYTIW